MVGFQIGMFLIVGLICGGLIRGAWIHLRRPDQKSALTLASNSAVVLWMVVRGVLHRVDSDYGPFDANARMVVSVASILIAYGVYRLILKPWAVREFPPAGV